MLPVFTLLVAALILQRVSEVLIGERNRRWAFARGGEERGRRLYPVIVGIHILFFFSLVLEWRYRARGWSPAWPLWLGLLIAAQFVRAWVIASLGRYWNTRIVIIPGMTPVVQGPYRFVRHPNYLAVVIELVALPAMCGAYYTAAVFSLANAAVLAVRIPQEERALEQASGQSLSAVPRFIPHLSHR